MSRHFETSPILLEAEELSRDAQDYLKPADQIGPLALESKPTFVTRQLVQRTGRKSRSSDPKKNRESWIRC